MTTTRMWRRPILNLLFTAGFASISCTSPTTTVVPNDEARVYALAVDVPFSELEIPTHSRPHSPNPPDKIPLRGWEKSKSGTYKTALPVRPRNLFFHRPPPGMEMVNAAGNPIPHKSTANHRTPFWTFDQSTITIHTQQKPDDADVLLVYPHALAREARMNQEVSDLPTEEFVRTAIQAADEYRSGLLLPAPGIAAWTIEVPPAATLRFAPGLARPEIADGKPSDGATLVIEVEHDDTTSEIWRQRVEPDSFDDAEVDLSRWSGEDIVLRMRTQPLKTRRFDYVFISEPVVLSPKEAPQRVILIFVDTLRPDHLGVYGYERDTSPSIDAFATASVVFDQARSVAPWTLPSARSVLTGRQPEYYGSATTLQRRVREAGWATAMFAGNLYLGGNFDMNRDWGLHRVVLWPSASDQVGRALSWLEANQGRDSLLLLHFMDAHLPYREPPEYRYLFANDPPETLQKEVFHLPDVRSARLKAPEDRQYVRDRYDNNIRYLHDQLSALFEALDDDDIVVYFSDHGEEFWEHKGYEHGHTLFDELLRVPLIIRGPGMPAGRISEPVSLLDVTPTVLDLLGLDHSDMDGHSLVQASRSEEARAAISQRDLAFGRPLYGTERWGVLHGAQKYTTNEGREAMYSLDSDPSEQSNLFLDVEEPDPGASFRPLLGQALGRDVGVGYRLTVSGMRNAPAHDTRVVLEVPGGVAHAFVGNDPTLASSASVDIREERVIATWHAGFRGSREVWVIPAKSMEEVTHGLKATAHMGEATAVIEVPPNKSASLPKVRVPLSRTTVGKRTVYLTYGIAPIPDDQMGEIRAFDAELKDALKAMGYLHEDEADLIDVDE